jgi:hypothetical protein
VVPWAQQFAGNGQGGGCAICKLQFALPVLINKIKVTECCALSHIDYMWTRSIMNPEQHTLEMHVAINILFHCVEVNDPLSEGDVNPSPYGMFTSQKSGGVMMTWC